MIGTNLEIPRRRIFLLVHSLAFFMCLALQIRASLLEEATPHLQVTWDEPLYGPARAGDVDSRRGWGREKAGTFLLQAFYRCVANLRETRSCSLSWYRVLFRGTKHHQSYPAMAFAAASRGSSASSYDFRAGYVAHPEILQA
jgi:hypothetical protein